MHANRIFLVGLLAAAVLAIDFTVGVNGGSTQCFYERLTYKTKYNVEVQPLGASKTYLTITHLDPTDHTQDTKIYERLIDSSDTVRISKFAPDSANYAICLQNLIDRPFQAAMKIQSGLELMEFSSLPNQDDKAHLDREVEQLEQQHNSLLESIKQVENAKSATQEMLNLMSTNTVWFGVVGLLTIILVNLGFQREIRKTLKERKLI